MPYRAVLFDVGDTLWHSAEAPPASEFRRIAAERAAAFLGAEGLHGCDPGLVSRTAWSALEDAMRQARATDRKEPDYAAIARAALEELNVRLSYTQSAALMEAIYVSGEAGGKAAAAGALETLTELRRRGFKLAVVTNRAFGGERFREDLRKAGLDIEWDVNVVSVEVGYLKPHPAIFRTALDGISTPAADAIMVGNSLLEDIAGAQALGMLAAWKRSEPDAEGVVPDYVFDDLPELLDWEPLRGTS
jgi:putative hydrolase of the HAD superfamily